MSDTDDAAAIVWDKPNQDALIAEFLAIARKISILWLQALGLSFLFMVAVMRFSLSDVIETIMRSAAPDLPADTRFLLIGAIIFYLFYKGAKEIADTLTNLAHKKGYMPSQVRSFIMRSTPADRLMIQGILTEAMKQHGIRQITAVRVAGDGVYVFDFSRVRALLWISAATVVVGTFFPAS